MTKLEEKFLQWIDRHLILLFFIIVNILGIIIRTIGWDFVSGDAKTFLLPWFYHIKELGGLKALAIQVGDYNIIYQFMISILTYFSFDPLILYKGLSIIFDYILAFGTALLTCEIVKKRTANIPIIFVTIYTFVLFLPTVIFNSSIWAQCDSIYTSFIVFSLYFLLNKKYKISFAFLGIAFSFKFQAIFILPFFLYYYFSEKKYSILNFLITILFFYIPCIPGFLFGRSLMDPIKIYLNQSNLYPYMWMNFPSFWVLVGNNYDLMSRLAIILTIFILGCGLFYILSQNIELSKPQPFLETAIWTVWTCLIFLPAMHERYGYLLEILLLILVFVNKKYFFCIIVAEISSILTYGAFLFQNGINIQVLSICYIIAYLVFSWMIISKRNNKRPILSRYK